MCISHLSTLTLFYVKNEKSYKISSKIAVVLLGEIYSTGTESTMHSQIYFIYQ